MHPDQVERLSSKERAFSEAKKALLKAKPKLTFTENSYNKIPGVKNLQLSKEAKQKLSEELESSKQKSLNASEKIQTRAPKP